MFITFEGMDFCGKSTQVKLLSDYLKQIGKNVITIREPGGTSISEKIRNILLDKNNKEMFVESELLLFSASRAQLVREIIIPKLMEGYFVLSDRFHDSSIAYQGYGRGINLEHVTKIQEFAIGEAIPDITFFIDIPIEEMEKRKLQFSFESLDRIELSQKRFYEKVRQGYLNLSKKNNRFVKIDGRKSIQDIHKLIVAKVL
ncbi:MAG: dTMP kinase [Ignavibacteriales bacterium CG_4_9_14_3_um_filter_34_10]|nr:MAG: dTMP kinase [Ignavibacteriales bacterium CG_4_9_14_3_um_filter_34_10]